MTFTSTSPSIDGLREIAGRYDAIVCDVWGVIHNGVRVHPPAVEALMRFREAGGAVSLLTNSPRRSEGVREQLLELGASAEAWDTIVTSGDVTRRLIVDAGRAIHHLGPARDRPLFEGLDVELVALDAAEAIVCTGLVEDETETPEDYRESLAPAAGQSLPFVCANPDLVVERGDRLIPCAGSLAMLYAQLGGETRMAGKPHAPIYALAMERLTALRPGLTKAKTLAIGDGMPTDVKGAIDNGFPLLFVTGGIHAADYRGQRGADPARLHAFLEGHRVRPEHWIDALQWHGGGA